MNINENGVQPADAMALSLTPIGEEQIKKFLSVLQKYKSGKSATESRILSSENWWKLRNSTEEKKTTAIGKDGGFVSTSGWLHNVIISKHADAMDSFPEPNILPREMGDREEARKLSAIIPCILEQNHFEDTYSDAMWQKLKTGTGVYKIVWDTSKLGGLGDIAVERVSLLNVYWEPGVTNIQNSRYFFHTELYDRDVLEQTYPELIGKLKGDTFISTKFLYDDHVDTENKITVIDVYYHKFVGGRQTLQYCKFVNDQVLYATENDPKTAMRGLYGHGLYPYVFDPLFPIEGSPLGYGYVDICRNPQTEIDLLKTSFMKNIMVGSTPRYFIRGENGNGGINEEEFLDLSNPLVHCKTVDENALRRIEYSALDGSYVGMLDRTIEELRETSGNTETSTGNVSSGVTAASAIAALQEASGKGSRDSTQASYRSYAQIIHLCIELVRQFYDNPRQFRILGQYGAEKYISYTNQNIKMRAQGSAFGAELGNYLPVFDIKVSAQKKNAYTKVAQNELAIQLFKMGFFNPQMTDQALMCLDMMDFDGKDEVMQKIARNGTMFDKLTKYMQLSLSFAAKARPDMVEGISGDIMKTLGVSVSVPSSAGVGLPNSEDLAGVGKTEPKIVANAREGARKAGEV